MGENGKELVEGGRGGGHLGSTFNEEKGWSCYCGSGRGTEPVQRP